MTHVMPFFCPPTIYSIFVYPYTYLFFYIIYVRTYSAFYFLKGIA